MIPMWKGKNPIYFEVITIIPFDNLYRQVYFVIAPQKIDMILVLLYNHNRWQKISLFLPVLLLSGTDWLQQRTGCTVG